ncbi:MAG: hypothetical protein WB723_05075 [Candidatus Acidiferrales bacterium]
MAKTCAAEKEMDMAGYDVQQMGDATEISTTPEAVPAPWLLVAIPGTLLVLIALSMSFFGGLIAAGFVYGAMYLLMHSKQATQYRAPTRFRVSKTGIEVNGNSIPKDAIHRVIIRNHVLQAAGDVIVVADPHPNSGQQNVVAGMNWAGSKLGPISYRVDAEARGVPTTLAGGLTEPMASAIMMDVNKALQLS